MPKKKFENDAVFLNQIPEFENVKTIKLEKDYLKVIYTNLFFTFTIVSIILIIVLASFELYTKGIFFGISLGLYFIFWLLIIIYYIMSFKRRSYSSLSHLKCSW